MQMIQKTLMWVANCSGRSSELTPSMEWMKEHPDKNNRMYKM